MSACPDPGDHRSRYVRGTYAFFLAGWLMSWKTSATLAVLGVAYLVWGFVLRTTTSWNMVFTGASVAVGSGVLAVLLYRARTARG